MKWIDLRSDTVTLPTEEMRQHMMDAEVGDDVYEDDPTVNQLQELAARMTGKEAALFVPSGTMGNLISIMVHTQRGDEVIANEKAHVVFHEVGGIGMLASCNIASVQNDTGFVYACDIIKKFRSQNIHYPRTSLVCIENALGNGTVASLKDMKETFTCAKELGLHVHMDGARLFNAATALGCDCKELTQYADSVMFCLSKGLCAPVGSMIVGTKAFVDKAKHYRKVLGGGMRQCGVLAACGIEALEVMSKRLQEDHDNARYLAGKLAALPYVEINCDTVQIDMVYFKITQAFDEASFMKHMAEHAIKINGQEDGMYRYVTHYGVTRTDIDQTIEVMRTFFESAVK